MKIAIFHELDFGGAKRVVHEFSKRLNKIFDVDIYYVDEKKDKNINKYVHKAYYYSFYPKKWQGNNWRVRLYKDTIELVNLYKLHKKIALDIKSRKYDFIFVHPSKFIQAPFLLRLLKNKCIYYCQEPLRTVYDPAVSSNIRNISFPKNLYEFLNRKIRKLIDLGNFNNASIILANSNFSKELIKKSYGKKAKVCYLGVDADLFKPQNLEKTIDVLFIGNKSSTFFPRSIQLRGKRNINNPQSPLRGFEKVLDKDKGYDILNKLSDYFNNKIKIRAIFREKNKLNITDEELAEVYNKSKVLIALNYNEPFGLIPLEAMACGTPVIAVAEGGYKESVLDNITGFLISRNSNELYQKIKNIINNDKLRQKMSENSINNILRNWTWDKSVENFLKIIKYAKK